MADEELGTGSVTITLDVSDVDNATDRLSIRLERALDRASRAAGRHIERNIRRAIDRIDTQVRIGADTSQLEAALNRFNNLGSAPLRITPDVDRAAFQAAVTAALSGIEVRVRVLPDMSRFNAAVRAHRVPDVNVGANTDNAERALSKLSGVLKGVGGVLGSLAGAAGGALKLGALGIAAASTAQSVAALGAALAPAVGLLAAGPAVILGYQAALGGLKLALTGVSDAFGTALTGDAEAFEKSIENLSPKAKAAAQEVRALKPAFEDLRNTVQDSFFSHFEGDITRTAEALNGPLTLGLSRIAAAWGRAAQGVLTYVQGSRGVANIESILDASALSVRGLAQTTNKLTAGFLQVGAAVSEAFGAEFAGGIADTGQKFGQFLQQIASNGDAVRWVDQALITLAQLGDVLGNVGSTLSGVFAAANDVGGGFLANLQQITQGMSDFANSAQGQEAIGNIFSALSAVAAQLAPILGAVVATLGKVAPALEPLFTTIGPAISSVIESLGPLIAGLLPGVSDVITALVDGLDAITSSSALGLLGTALGQVLTAAAPLLPVIGELVAVIGTGLAQVLGTLATALSPVIGALSGALLPVLPVLAGSFQSIVTALAPLVQLLGRVLAGAITTLAPLLGTLAGLVGTVATALAPLIEQLVAGLAPVFAALQPVLAEVATQIGLVATELIAALLPALPPLIDAFVSLLPTLIPLIPPLVGLIAAAGQLDLALIKVLAPVIKFAAELIKWQTLTFAVPLITGIVTALSVLVGQLTKDITSVSQFVTSAVQKFRELKNSTVTSVTDMANQITAFFNALPGRINGAVSSIPGLLSALFDRAKAAVIARLTSLAGDAITLLRGLPARAAAALAGADTALSSAGANLVRGFIGGIRSQAANAAGAAVDAMKGAISAARNALGIASPSKVFAAIGRFTGQGFINGLTGAAAGIKSAAEGLVAKIREAFASRNTRLDDALISQVQSTERKLLALAARRDAIAEQIKKANEFAVSTAQQAAGTGALSGLGAGGGNVKNLVSGIDAAVARIRKFNAQVNALAQRGLRKDLLAQVIGLGPDQGAELAKTLSAASSGQLKALNEAQKQLAAASSKLGRDAADKLFDAGVEASKGFLAGLKDQQKDIQDLMLVIARSMTKAIRDALQIHSPSRLFRGIGRYTMDGLDLGMQDRLVALRRTVVGAAAVLSEPFRAGVSLGSGGGLRGAQAGYGGFGGGVTHNRTQTVSPGAIVINQVGDAEATARRVLSRLVAAQAL